MTERRRPAAATRVLVTGGSIAATLGLVAAMAAAGAPGESAVTVPGQNLRVVITDQRIDRDAAIAAALEGHRSGQATVQVPVGPGAQPATQERGRAPHTRTRSS